MNVAGITVTYNDDYKLDEWIKWYNIYKDELSIHIIVDNHSNNEYLQKVKQYFKNSIIIERDSNGGSTIAYNDGIKLALSQKSQFIALIGNDIKLQKGAISKCINELLDNPDLGMVSPIMFDKDSMYIQDFGDTINNLLIMCEYKKGELYENINERVHYCDCIPGGMNIAKREFYESVGLQDERLFMYSDEVDMGIRAKNCGYKLASIGDALSWHQHINYNLSINKRHPYSSYLIARNKVYLAQKHYGFIKKIKISSYFISTSIYGILKSLLKGNFRCIKGDWWKALGAINGFIGNMKPNKYSHM